MNRFQLVAATMLCVASVGCDGSDLTGEQQQALSRIEALGGRRDDRCGMYPFLIPAGAPSEPAVESIDLRGTKVNDDDLQNLEPFTGLSALTLSETKITDAGL